MNVSDVISLPFRWGSSIRGRRFFHPVGVLAQGHVERLAPAHCGLPIPSSEAIVRVSKAVGTPGSLPDLIGLAIRITPEQISATPWDILLVSAGSGVVARALALRPATSWTGQTLTTLMPLIYRDQTWWLRARITSEISGNGLSLDSVKDHVQTDGIVVALDQACGRSDFEPLARLTLTTVINAEQADVAFDPVVNTAPGLTLYPRWLADLRVSAYQRSREGRSEEPSPSRLAPEQMTQS